MTLAGVFPGQGSQSVGMLKELALAYPIVERTFQEASDVLALDLWKLAQEGPDGELARTTITQPLMLSAGVSVWRVWRENGGSVPSLAAGHSLGEYTALVSAGVLRFGDAVMLVAARGRFMQEAVPAGKGAMAAILGLDEGILDEVCRAASSGTEIVSCANFNAPGQIVIAGDSAAVERAANDARSAGAKRAIPLSVSAPFHCDLMTSAAERLKGAMEKYEFSPPEFPVVHNVDVGCESGPAGIKSALYRQVARPVQWIRTVEYFVAQGIATVVEFGCGKVLSSMCKRIDRQLACCAVYDPASLEAALQAGGYAE